MYVYHYVQFSCVLYLLFEEDIKVARYGFYLNDTSVVDTAVTAQR